MDVSIDAVAKIREIGRVEIPEVFLKNRQIKHSEKREVGKVSIPNIFSAVNENDEYDDDRFRGDKQKVFMKVTNEMEL